MEARFLFPHHYKLIGWIIAIPSLALGLFIMLGNYELDWLTVKLPFHYYFTDTFTFGNSKVNTDEEVSVLNLTDEVASVGTIIGLLFVAFSRVKIEDEYVSKIRLESLQWAIYLNFGLLILATIFIHGSAFFNVIVYNMFTPLLFFIIRFHYILFIKPSFEASKQLKA
ncbi:hypothetical protein [Emticicia fluvialis]|uniref:hypothetical protein n=1 Tax=Emticicia fluvialis TaxID=2974474 RepID=UPI002165BF76|nr:hypothetical protein [Emticicia fluvialis]